MFYINIRSFIEKDYEFEIRIGKPFFIIEDGIALVKKCDMQNMIIIAKRNLNREASISLYELEGCAVHHLQTK